MLRVTVSMKTFLWRRLDYPGLELMHLQQSTDGVVASTTIMDASEKPFVLRGEWRLDSHWRSRLLTLEFQSEDFSKRLHIERSAIGWSVDGVARPDLAECLEIDVSATPFCNGLAVRALKHEPGDFTALYVDASDLSVQPSRQAYEWLGPRQWRHIDKGVDAGFTAVLDFDADHVVTTYEGLFARL